jgi:hypothetical protein
MRAATGFAAVLLALALAPAAKAQFTVSGSSGQTVNQPVNTGQNVSTINTIQLFDHSIKLSDFLPAMHLPQSRPVFGKSTFPTESDGTFGMNYLKAFGFTGKSPPHPTSSVFVVPISR